MTAVPDEFVHGSLRDGRAVVEVRVAPCERELLRLGRVDDPPTRTARAMIDTTRLVSSVSTRLLEDLGIITNAVARGRRRAGTEIACVSLVLASPADTPIVMPNVPVINHNAAPAPIMLGVDVLKRFRFTYSGTGQTFVLERTKRA